MTMQPSGIASTAALTNNASLSTTHTGSRNFSGKVRINPAMRSEAFMRHLDIRHYQLDEHVVGDILLNTGSIIFVKFSQLLDSNYRRGFAERVRVCKPGTNSMFYICLAEYESADHEPPMDILSFLNQTCFTCECTPMLCCGADDTHLHIMSIAESSVVSMDTLRDRTADTDFGAVVQGLTEIQTLNKRDGERLASRYTSVADLLMSAEEDAVAIQGFSAAKASRVHHVFNAEFPTTQRRLHEITQDGQQQLGTAAQREQVTTTAVVQALERVDRDDDDAENDPYQLSFNL